jgi:hypothetical protein
MHPLGENRTVVMTNSIIILLIILLDIVMPVTWGENKTYGQDALAIEINLTLDRQSYKTGEFIKAVCDIRNVSDSLLWLPPLQVVDVDFTLCYVSQYLTLRVSV